ncbi:S-adenosyl-L-methionine-dependent methyltransferase [Bimuria novae-zelandiae CBS 107.79]|uniref:S-adenosyl-L-methionine-dependent methyltransferase n=1 Tax=Bimuria novae-zelandiae CBS 107.79 TaxID=1447943 RepID=A0A6A5VU25_9PLEO|nr:S-adenosyl-L-methionine-dependent methyltransferase [Bimuria novae-zelandiae CBS 107.79]
MASASAFANIIKANPSLGAIFNYDNFRLAPALDAKASSAFLHPNEQLEQALRNSHAKGLPPISVGRMAAQWLGVLTRVMGARSVLEVGTLGGYSSIVFAQAGAHVTSIEIDPKHRTVALENTAGLDVEIILGAALDVLPRLHAEGRTFDLIFIDADFEDQGEHFDWAVKLAKKGGGVLLDDVVPTMVVRGEVVFKREGGVEIKKETVLERIGRDRRVRAGLVPVVQCVGEEPVMGGFVLAVVE